MKPTQLVRELRDIEKIADAEIVEKSGFADAVQAYLALVRPEKLRLQLKHVRECGLRTDLAILFETVRILIQTRLPV